MVGVLKKSSLQLLMSTQEGDIIGLHVLLKGYVEGSESTDEQIEKIRSSIRGLGEYCPSADYIKASQIGKTLANVVKKANKAAASPYTELAKEAKALIDHWMTELNKKRKREGITSSADDVEEPSSKKVKLNESVDSVVSNSPLLEGRRLLRPHPLTSQQVRMHWMRRNLLNCQHPAKQL